MATRNAYLHFGLPAPSTMPERATEEGSLPLDLGEG